MALVNVWNDNTYPFSQEFKGNKITIPPKSSIEMDYEEAVEFRGLFSPVVKNTDGVPLPESYKMIRVERPAQPQVDPSANLVNHATGQRAATPEELQKMLETVAHMRVSDPDLDKAGTKEDVTALKTKNAELEARLAAMEAHFAKQAQPKKGKG